MTDIEPNGHTFEPLENAPRASSVPKIRGLPFLTTFLALFALWVLLSGKFDPLHLGLGLISCAIVAYISGDLLFPEGMPKGLFHSLWLFLKYVPWILYQIWLANLHLLYLTFHPRMIELIDPQIIHFKSKLTKDLSLVTFANSITLTPGTITVSVSVDGDFTVHAIDRVSAEPLPGEMEKRIATAFGED